MKRENPTLWYVVAALLLAALAVGCAGQPATPTPTPELKVALLVNGSINDGGFNQAGYRGLQAVERELAAKISYSEKVSVADAEPALREYAEQGYRVVFAHSFEYGDPVLKVAGDYPETYFVVWTGIVSQAPNVASIELLEQESGYLMGVLAGSMTQSDMIAAVGGADLPVIVRILEGYKLGAKSVNSDVRVMTTYVGAWDDPARGKEAALAQIEAGADVLYHVADKTGLGVIQAAQEGGVYALGSASDQSSVAPGTVLSSSTEVVESAYRQLVRAVLDGSFEAKVYKLGLASGSLDYAPMPDSVPKDVQDLVEETKKAIIDGTLEVPEVTQPTGP